VQLEVATDDNRAKNRITAGSANSAAAQHRGHHGNGARETEEVTDPLGAVLEFPATADGETPKRGIFMADGTSIALDPNNTMVANGDVILEDL